MQPVCGPHGGVRLADHSRGGAVYPANLWCICRPGAPGGKRGTIAIALYLVLGAVGLPVFSGFRGGFGVLFGTTGGYIFGFLLSGLLYWVMTALLGNRPWVQLLALVLGTVLCYAAGTGWFMLVYLQKTGPISLGVVLAKCVIPFLLPDAGKTGPGVAPHPPLGPFCPLSKICPVSRRFFPIHPGKKVLRWQHL